jgi:hypothetical protein
LDVIAAAMKASPRFTELRVEAYETCCGSLQQLLANSDERASAAVRAGVLAALAAPSWCSTPLTEIVRTRILPGLQAAAQRHDASACTHADCKLCAERAPGGKACSLPGCGLRKRADDSGKALKICSRCRAAVYCGPAHQRADWARHKAECATLGERTAGGS